MAISRAVKRYGAALAAMALVLAACGTDDGETEAATNSDLPTVVVTTNILGDVVGELVGDQAEVITIMPVGADPHDFQPSAQEVDQILEADALIVNGSDFEEGLLDVIDSAGDAGVPMFEATSAIETIEYGPGGHDDHGHEDEHSDEEGHEDEHKDEEEGNDHSDEEGEEGHDDEHKDEEEGHDHSDEEGEEGHEDEHSDEEGHEDEHKDEEEGHEHEDEHGHDHDGADPHFFTDPTRMADAVEGIGAFLTAEVEGLDAAAIDTAVADYTAELDALDAEIEVLVEGVPSDRRVLITNHEVFGYFADRYGFEVVGTVIPGGSTVDSASAGELAPLVEVIEAEGVPAIFTDAASSSSLAETLAAEVGEVAIVDLFTESLGDAESEGATYLDMVRTNAARISAALA